MNRRVIIPAAGNSIRIGGIPKELLPIGNGECCLERAVRLARTIGEPLVITNREKYPLHRKLLPDVTILYQREDLPELWGAIRSGLKSDTAGALILPDTVTSFKHDEIRTGNGHIKFGTFITKTPERFSVIMSSHRLATKEPAQSFNGRINWTAWGVVLWSKVATNLMMECEATHYDRAFEQIMVLGFSTFPLEYYYDIGTFEAYREFLSCSAR